VRSGRGGGGRNEGEEEGVKGKRREMGDYWGK